MSIIQPDTSATSGAPEQDALEPSAVLRRRPGPDVEWVEVDGEIVAWNADSESLHLLDPIAALVFQLLDGVSTLETTSQDLAGAFNRDIDQVRADVLRFAAALQDIGVAERIR